MYSDTFKFLLQCARFSIQGYHRKITLYCTRISKLCDSLSCQKSLSPVTPVNGGMARKGKEVAGKASDGKRKRDEDEYNDKTGGGRRMRNRAVLQFFEDAAGEDDFSDSSYDSDIDNCVHFSLSLSLSSVFCVFSVHCVCFRVFVGDL
jgi:hypothetical protein